MKKIHSHIKDTICDNYIYACKKDEYVKTIEKYEEANLETGEKITVEKVTESGFYKNLDSIDIDSVEFVNDEYGSEAANTFRHKDKARRKIRAYEYWGYWDVQGDGVLKSIVATWVGKTLIRLEVLIFFIAVCASLGRPK